MRVEQLVVGASFSFLAMDCAAQVADAGPDTLLCEGAYTMQGSAVPVGGTGTWTLLMGCATIIDPNAPSSEFTGLCAAEKGTAAGSASGTDLSAGVRGPARLRTADERDRSAVQLRAGGATAHQGVNFPYVQTIDPAVIGSRNSPLGM